MQHVTAFTSPQTVPAAPVAAPKRSLWILNSWRDLILYVGTPLLLVPMFALAQARWSAQDIYIFVAAHPEAHYHLGLVLFTKGDLEGAKIHYLETLRLDPKAPVHNNLGVVYMRLGQTSQAIAQFNEALRMRPDDATAAENLRFVLSRETPGSSTPP